MIRFGNAQFIKKHVTHRVVVVLPGMHDLVGNLGFPSVHRPYQRCDLHKVRPGSGDQMNGFHKDENVAPRKVCSAKRNLPRNARNYAKRKTGTGLGHVRHCYSLNCFREVSRVSRWNITPSNGQNTQSPTAKIAKARENEEWNWSGSCSALLFSKPIRVVSRVSRWNQFSGLENSSKRFTAKIAKVRENEEWLWSGSCSGLLFSKLFREVSRVSRWNKTSSNGQNTQSPTAKIAKVRENEEWNRSGSCSALLFSKPIRVVSRVSRWNQFFGLEDSLERRLLVGAHHALPFQTIRVTKIDEQAHFEAGCLQVVKELLPMIVR